MARKSVSEDDMGLAPSEAEMATTTQVVDDDISLADDVVEEQPRVEAEPAPAEQKPAEDPGKVDIRALQEARAESREARQRAAVLEQRWNDFLAGQQAQPKQEQPRAEPEIPDPDTDPQGAIKFATQFIRDLKTAQQRAGEEHTRRTTEQSAFASAFSRVNGELAETTKADPTVTEAHTALRTSWAQEYAALGYQQHEIAQAITHLENEHIAYIAQNNLRPGDYLKSLAGARGWQPKAAAPAAPAAPVAQQQPSVATLRQTQQRHMSLSDAPGGAAPAPLDAKAIAKMSDKDFKAFMRTKGAESKLDEVLGA